MQVTLTTDCVNSILAALRIARSIAPSERVAHLSGPRDRDGIAIQLAAGSSALVSDPDFDFTGLELLLRDALKGVDKHDFDEVPLLEALAEVLSDPNRTTYSLQEGLQSIARKFLRPEEYRNLSYKLSREVNPTCASCGAQFEIDEMLSLVENEESGRVEFRCTKCHIPKYKRCSSPECDACIERPWIDAKRPSFCTKHQKPKVKKAPAKKERGTPAPPPPGYEMESGAFIRALNEQALPRRVIFGGVSPELLRGPFDVWNAPNDITEAEDNDDA